MNLEYFQTQYANHHALHMYEAIRSVQQREWFLQVIGLLKETFPHADHYCIPSHRSLMLKVGRRSLSSTAGSPVFHLYLSEGKTGFNLTGGSKKLDAIQRILHTRYQVRVRNGHYIDADQPVDTVRERIQQIAGILKEFNWTTEDHILMGEGHVPKDYLEQPDLSIQSESDHPTLMCHDAVNKIFYGAAGTGKTYRLQQLQQVYTEQLTQQDHATFLAEKLRDLTWRDVICLVFLDEQRLLRVPEIVGHPYFRAKVTASNRTDNINQTVWGTLMRHTPVESTTVKYALKRRADLALFDKDDAGLWHLLDPQDDQLKELYELLDTLKRGAQPTETIERMSFVTFHQSYGYEDFIEGLRPVLNDDSDDGQVRYEIRRGVFVALCERARRDPEHGYALFIDEINRGNVSKILGELITLIELDKREGAPNAIRVRLPYSGDWFSVPANVSIYGSMNSADRSLTPLDTALRRRFEFEEILPDPMLLAGRVIEGIALDELLSVINARIELLLGRDCLLGHAYFYPVQCFADLQTVMQQKIVPQLQEYFFDDWRKIRWVLNDHRKPAALQLIHEHDPQAQMLALFGEELDVPMQPTYTLNSSAFAQIDSYQMIIG